MSYALLFITDIVVPLLIIWSRKAKFSKANLQSDEKIIAIGKTHWIVLLYIIIPQILITTFCIFDIQNKSEQTWSMYLFLTIFFIVLWSQVVTYCREFVITNKRVLLKIGIISRTTKEFRYEKLESCDVKQGLLGRMLSFGTVIISGVGGSVVKEPYVQGPLAFRQYLIDCINSELCNTNEATQPTSSQLYSIEELRAYKKLLDEGIITKEEFDKKKQEILERKP